MKSQMESQSAQQLCVICCDLPKAVVLMPCRHLCLCEPCSKNKKVKQCPICRKQISDRISVFS